MKRPRSRIACWHCGKVCGIHADGTLWAHVESRYGPLCVGSDRRWDDHTPKHEISAADFAALAKKSTERSEADARRYAETIR